MTAALLLGPGVLVGLSLILAGTARLERLLARVGRDSAVVAVVAEPDDCLAGPDPD